MKYKNKIIATILAIMLALSTTVLTSCGDDKNTDSTQTTTSSKSTKNTTESKKSTDGTDEIETETRTEVVTDDEGEVVDVITIVEPVTDAAETNNNSSGSNSSGGSGSSSSGNSGGSSSGTGSGTTQKPTVKPTQKPTQTPAEPTTNPSDELPTTAGKTWHEAVYETIYHPAEIETIEHQAETEQKWVVDKEAYTYEEPVYEMQCRCICNDCGSDITDMSNVERIKHAAEHLEAGGKGSWSDRYINTQVGTKTVFVPEEGHYETVVVKEAWTETIVIKEAWTEKVLVKEAGWY